MGLLQNWGFRQEPVVHKFPIWSCLIHKGNFHHGISPVFDLWWCTVCQVYVFPQKWIAAVPTNHLSFCQPNWIAWIASTNPISNHKTCYQMGVSGNGPIPGLYPPRPKPVHWIFLNTWWFWYTIYTAKYHLKLVVFPLVPHFSEFFLVKSASEKAGPRASQPMGLPRTSKRWPLWT